MIASDGVFSMDGDLANLKEICDVADEFNAIVMIDECHATGFLGKTGRGTEELLDVAGRVDIINSTLGKAMGGAAGIQLTHNTYQQERCLQFETQLHFC
jgi:glycine C-acetyltransferase